MARVKLTEKERRFVAAYLGEANGNGTEAVRVAGYRGTPGSLRVKANRLLTKGNVAQAVADFQAVRDQEAIATADERDRLLTDIARSWAADGDRIRAVAELNRVGGRHVTRLADPDGNPLSFTVVTGVPPPK